jgi:NAD(P)-dependent dehydrogenase (short-subunit alcohol dehydrogenase family)
VLTWRESRGAFLFSQAVLPLLLKNTNAEHPPTLIFTSATAAMKGSALCSSFATGKFAMRALAQSLAREFGPKGVHVNHAIIDGVIDIERTKGYNLPEHAKIKPDAIADAYWYLHTQPLNCVSTPSQPTQGFSLYLRKELRSS